MLNLVELHETSDHGRDSLDRTSYIIDIIQSFMTNVRHFLELEVQLLVLHLVSLEECLEIMVNGMQELADLLHRALRSSLTVVDFCGNIILHLVPHSHALFVVVIHLMKEHLADFDELVVVELVIHVVGRHVKV